MSRKERRNKDEVRSEGGNKCRGREGRMETRDKIYLNKKRGITETRRERDRGEEKKKNGSKHGSKKVKSERNK